MNVRVLLLGIASLCLFAWQFGASPESAHASRAPCNPAILHASGSSTVNGVIKTASGGPGTDVSDFPPIERTTIAPALDITPGMTYRGGGRWADNAGNELRLSITATRNQPATGSGSTSGACQIAFLEQSLRHDVPEADPTTISGSGQVVYTVGYQLNNNNGTGPGQTYYLQVAVNVTPATTPPPTTPPPTPPPAGAPALSVSGPTCQGSTANFTLSWTQIPTNGYRLYYNGAASETYPATANSAVIGLAPGTSATVRINAVNSQNEVPSNTLTIAADTQTCAVVPPPPPPSPTTPGPFTVNVTTTCINPSTVQVSIRWTASSGNPRYLLAAIDTGNATLLTTAGQPDTPFVYTEPAGAWSTRYYHLSASNIGGIAFATPGTGAVDAGLDGSWRRFGVAMPNCTPNPPGAFTAALATRCLGTTPVGRLTWTAASGATSYRVYDTSTPGATADLGSLTATGPQALDVILSRANPSFAVDALNGAGRSTATATASLPDCTPEPTITLAAINSVCSAGSPSNVLRWTSDDGVGGTLNDFTILRDGASISAAAGTTYTDTTAAQGTTYAYAIQSGTTTSPAQSVATAVCPQPPGPLTLSISAACADSAPVNRLSWTTAPTATRYQVLRDGATQPLTTINAPATTYVDTAVAAGESHGYVIRALNDVGARDSANEQVTVANCVPATVNNPPVATDDSATTGPATPITVGILVNDTDPDGNLDPTTVRIIQAPSNGSATVSTGSVIYTPNVGFAGTDTLTYEVCDTTALCDTALVTITVTAAPPPPPSPVLPGPLTLSIQALCVGQAPQHILTWTAATATDSYSVKRNGVTVITTATTTYIDTTVVAGSTYAYAIDATNNAGVTTSNEITTAAPTNCVPPANNLPPIANDDTAATDQGSFVVIPVLVNDTDPDGNVVPSCTRVITQPGHGTTVVDSTSGAVAYTPAPGFSGTDTFIYEICDDKGATDTATVTVTVRPPAPTTPKRPPQANDDTATTPHNTPINIDILLNDADPDGDLDQACVKVTRQPGHGTVSINATNGRTNYTPTNGFAGTDTFQYTVCDKTAAVSNVATVSIAVGQAPPAALTSTGIPIFGFLIDLWNRLLTLIGLR